MNSMVNVGLIKCKFCSCLLRPNKDVSHYTKAHYQEWQESRKADLRKRMKEESKTPPKDYVNAEKNRKVVFAEEFKDLDYNEDYNEWNPLPSINAEEAYEREVLTKQPEQAKKQSNNKFEVNSSFNENGGFVDTNAEFDKWNSAPNKNVDGVLTNSNRIGQDSSKSEQPADCIRTDKEEIFGKGASVQQQQKRARECYIPAPPPIEEREIFDTGIPTGKNFYKLNYGEVHVIGSCVPKQLDWFANLELHPLLKANLKKSRFYKPTKVQKVCMPIIASGRDLMGCAQTGSGKTAAFLIPIIDELLRNPKGWIIQRGCIEPQVLIMCPTRELALQIFHEARKFSYNTDIVCQVIYGGACNLHQLKLIQEGCHILIATPGRLNSFFKQGVIAFSSIRFVVLDEADRMLDMGFLRDMESLLKHSTMTANEQHQTLMFSATFPKEVQDLAADFLNERIFASVGGTGRACGDVVQKFIKVDKFGKRSKLVEVLKENGSDKTLVFVEKRVTADFITSFLCQNQFQATSIHGDRLQSAREQALEDFKRGVFDILVATSVVARGLDIRGVNHVINFDLPHSIDWYIHRIGRTGRIGNTGRATSFYDSTVDGNMAAKLAKVLREASQYVPEFLTNDLLYRED